MIKEFVEAWEKHNSEVRQEFAKKEPGVYSDVVAAVVAMLGRNSDDGPVKFQEVNLSDADSGELIYVMTSEYAHSYWTVVVGYGTCSHCDSLSSAQTAGDEAARMADYMTLALHIIQRIKPLE